MAGQFLNGTHEFSELVPARMSLLVDQSRSVLKWNDEFSELVPARMSLLVDQSRSVLKWNARVLRTGSS